VEEPTVEETPVVEETPAEQPTEAPVEQPKTAYYICSCGYATTDKHDMALHIVAGGKIGEIHSYTTDYR
jgi:hypothetical protein